MKGPTAQPAIVSLLTAILWLQISLPGELCASPPKKSPLPDRESVCPVDSLILSGQEAVDELKQRGIYDSIKSSYLATQYNIDPVQKTGQASYQAANPAQPLS